jgi:hypothetical protein
MDRRRILRSVVWVVAAAALRPRLGGALPNNEAAENTFFDLSRLLTGRADLDRQASSRLLLALEGADGAFSSRMAALADFARTHGFTAVELLAVALDAQDSQLAAVLHRIIAAWYTGVVGDGPASEVIEYRYALMFEPVADAVSPCSYCEFAPLHWTSAPSGLSELA